MISKILVAMDGSEASLKAYEYTSFRDFDLPIRNKLKMSKHALFGLRSKVPSNDLQRATAPEKTSMSNTRRDFP